MKIAASDITLASQRVYAKTDEVSESLRAWRGGQRPDFEGRDRTHGHRGAAAKTSWSAAGKAKCHAAGGKDCGESEDAGKISDARLLVLKAFIERLTGKKIEVIDPQDLTAKGAEEAAQQASEPAPAPESAGYGVEYDYYERHTESEKTSFSAQGVIQTADGRRIEIAVDLTLQRKFVDETSLSLRLGDAKLKDPLVINFAGTAAQVTQTKFKFDIDGDGQAEALPTLAPGSGYLALDKNQDGAINDGTELFGPATGQGFSELAQYDTDGNHWVDENDSVFGNLKIWSQDEAGHQQLLTLAQAGVGAIYLGNVPTLFDLKSPEQALLARIQATSIFLKEDGSAGTVQQLDFAV